MGSLHSLMGRREYGTGPVRAAESLIASLRADSYIIKSYDIYGVNKYRSKEDNNNIGTVYIKGYYHNKSHDTWRLLWSCISPWVDNLLINKICKKVAKIGARISTYAYGKDPVSAAHTLLATLRGDNYVINEYIIYRSRVYTAHIPKEHVMGTVNIQGYGEYTIKVRTFPGGLYRATLT